MCASGHERYCASCHQAYEQSSDSQIFGYPECCAWASRYQLTVFNAAQDYETIYIGFYRLPWSAMNKKGLQEGWCCHSCLLKYDELVEWQSDVKPNYDFSTGKRGQFYRINR